MQYSSKKGREFKWLHVFCNVLRASMFLRGKSRTENMGMCAASLTHAGSVGHAVYSQDHLVTGAGCAGSAAQVP